MRYGRGEIPEGFLPVFSVNSEAEAKALLVLCCSRAVDGTYYSNELARSQDLKTLQRFSDKLAERYPIAVKMAKKTP